MSRDEAGGPAQRLRALPGLVESRIGVLRRAWNSAGPQALAALLAAAAGALLMRPQFAHVASSLRMLNDPQAALGLADMLVLPRVLLGLGLVLMSLGLLARARVAWVITLLLSLLGAGDALVSAHRIGPLFVLCLLQLAVLVLWARRFNRSSIAAGSLFALLSIGSLMLYGMLGSLWFGEGYTPPIRNLGTALYYAVETMSTVGYGDIVPRTLHARMFTVSLIVLGITVFATTLSLIIGPVIGGSIKRALEGRMQKQQRRNHYVILGISALAYTTWKALQQRGVPVTVVVSSAAASPFPPEADVVVGDATSNEVLERAGVPHAKAVLTLREDDAENAFAVLAVKELAPGVKTIAGVNDARHVAKIRRVQPDLLFAPQLLGSDLLVRSLFDEPIDNQTVAKLLFADPD